MILLIILYNVTLLGHVHAPVYTSYEHKFLLLGYRLIGVLPTMVCVRIHYCTYREVVYREINLAVNDNL